MPRLVEGTAMKQCPHFLAQAQKHESVVERLAAGEDPSGAGERVGLVASHA